MPQSSPSQLNSRQPFQIAQAETSKGASEGREAGEGGKTHAGTEHGEKKHTAGEVPDAVLLFQNSVLVVLVMLGFAMLAKRQFEKVPRGVQNLGEWMVEGLRNFTVNIIGAHGAKYTPLVGTVFLYIFLMNLIGLVPGLHSPTANLSITLALGLVVFVVVQFEGIRSNGFGNYIKHFMGPSIGGKFPELFFLLGPIELISEIIKPFTLAVRLFGNIFGEDVIIVVLAGLAGTLGGSALGWIPVQFPLMFLALLTSLVQATVFTILTCIYLSLMTHHEHEGGHGEEGSHDAAHSHATGH